MMRQLEQALVDLSERAEVLPPEILISRVEARLSLEGLPIEGEPVAEPSVALARSASPVLSARLRRARSFAMASAVTLIAVGITALVVRNDIAPIADESASPTTASVAPTVPLTEVRLATVPGPLARPATIAVAGPGDIWVGAGDGIWHVSREEASRKGRGDVADLAIAPDGTVWAAFWWDNVTRLAGLENETWLDYPQPDGSFNNITADQHGTLWWAGNTGVHRLDGREWVVVNEALPQSFDVGQRGNLEVRVEAAPDGTVWVGTWWGWTPEAGGLTRFDGNEWAEIPLPEGKPTPVYNLAVAPNGDLWVVLVEPVPGTEDSWSLARFDGDSWSVFSEADGMPQNIVYSMAVGSDGVVWLTQLPTTKSPVASGGAVAFDGEQWTSFLEDENVQDVVVDSDGTVWLAGDRLYKIER